MPEANSAAEKIRALDRRGADDLHEVIASRAYGRPSAKETNPQLRGAADDVEKFLGGKVKPEDVKPSDYGDLIVLKGNKKFRSDVLISGNSLRHTYTKAVAPFKKMMRVAISNDFLEKENYATIQELTILEEKTVPAGKKLEAIKL